MRNSSQEAVPQAQLTLFRAVCIIVGVIVGSGIFQTPWLVASNVSSWWGLSPTHWVLLVWFIGGLIAFLGALCYAELATTYPRQGGDYVYLNRAFGGWCGFLFGWARLAIIQGGSIGAIAFVFGNYASRLWPLMHSSTAASGAEVASQATAVATITSAALYAIIAMVVLTAINVIGVREGTLTQNILTSAKVLGLASVFLVAFLFTPAAAPIAASPAAAPGAGAGDFALAMVLISWTYGGWNEIAYITAEVRDPRRNITRSLVIGVALVTLIYVLLNWAFLHSLGIDKMRESKEVACDVLKIKFGEKGERAIAALVVISALGALNGFIFTSARVYYAMGSEHRLLSPLGYWSKRFGTPAISLVVQAAIVIALIIAFGTSEGFERMVKFTAAAFWLFIALTTCALIALRDKDRDIERPYRVPFYPFVPIIFCGFSVYMVYRSYDYAPTETLYALIALVIGLPIYALTRLLQRSAK
ncbi:amino acid permease [Candidatus Sumerlaeota bacterium]|nr:amino acid permease [Candidatus Sumerlaeota bacterium]